MANKRGADDDRVVAEVADRLRRRGLEHQIVHVAEAPVFARLEAPHDGVFGLVEVLCRMPVERVVAAADVTALEAETQVHPLVARLKTFLAPVRRLRVHGTNLRQMFAL